MNDFTPTEIQLQSQLFELESRLAFQDDALQQLNNLLFLRLLLGFYRRQLLHVHHHINFIQKFIFSEDH